MAVQQQEATSRHNALLEAGQEIARLNAENEALTIVKNAHARRADRAEAVVRQLEARLAHPAQEVRTLYTKMKLDADRAKHDAAMANLASEGWTFVCDGTLLIADPVERYTTFIRTAPIEPTPDQPSAMETVAAAATNVEIAATPEPAYPLDPAAFPPAHSSITGLWNALYQMDRYAELVQHWPKLRDYAPRVYAVFADAGCDMADVVIMKSFRPGRRDDQHTMKIIFRSSSQIALRTRQAMAVAGLERVIAREGREFIFDLPPKTVKADAVLDASVTPDVSVNGHARNFGQIASDRAALNALAGDESVDTKTFTHMVLNSRLPRQEQTELLNSRLLHAGQTAFDRRPQPARSYPRFGVQS